MNRFEERVSPEFSANKLLFDLKETTIPVNLDSIAEKLKIDIVYEDLDSVEGLLLVGSHKTFIIVAKSRYIARSRFSIAHEIGHFILHSDIKEFLCLPEHMNSFYKNNELESEANRFAASLLLPARHFDPIVKKYSPTIELFQAISEKYEVSITCAAIRFVNITDDSVALVMSRHNTIDYVVYSRSFKGNVANSFLDIHELKRSRKYSRTIDAENWLSNTSYSKVKEESLWMPNLKSVLTVITPVDDDLYDEYEEYEDY